MALVQQSPRLQVRPHSFSNVPAANVQRSSFNRSCGYKTTFNAGDLVPVFLDEALPGDTFSLNMTTFGRLATPIAPLMDNLYCDAFFFAVPYRLVWSNWEKFMGAQANPGDSTDYLVPQSTAPAGGYAVGSLQDYLGLPTGVAGYSHSALPLRAINLIWNEWFRDQNLQNSVTVDKSDGPDTTTYTLLKRGKRHDYFTSCLPWPQKGSAVTLPLGTSVPVIRTSSTAEPTFDVAPSTTGVNIFIKNDGGNTLAVTGPNQSLGQHLYWGSATGLKADLTQATAATINALRQSLQIQAMLERDARSGTRYTELIRAHFGVVSPDFRLQRPEYLGGGSTMINVSPIPQTSATASGTTPQGSLAAMGTFSHTNMGFTKSFTEHCLVIGMVSVRAALSYQQGLERHWSRRTRYDFYWPALAHLGEQAVLNQEIYCQGTAGGTADAGVFGYQERYAEYRYKPSLITGQFRSTYSTPLDYWHLGQKFTSLPTLGATFIQENPPVSRVVAVPSAPQFLFDSVFDFRCARPMPVYSVPGLVDRF